MVNTINPNIPIATVRFRLFFFILLSLAFIM
jgi:hypothetical protein